MVAEEIYIARNTRSKAIGGINEETIDMGWDMYKDWEEAGMGRDALMSFKVNVFRLFSNLDAVMENSEGAKAY